MVLLGWWYGSNGTKPEDLSSVSRLKWCITHCNKKCFKSIVLNIHIQTPWVLKKIQCGQNCFWKKICTQAIEYHWTKTMLVNFCLNSWSPTFENYKSQQIPVLPFPSSFLFSSSSTFSLLSKPPVLCSLLDAYAVSGHCTSLPNPHL